METTDLRTQLEKLGISIVNDVMAPGDAERPFSDKVDALKALTALYATLHKSKALTPPGEEDEGFTFDQNFDGAKEQGHDDRITPLRGSQRRRPGAA